MNWARYLAPMLLLALFAGCLGTAAQMIYFIRGNNEKPAFGQLKGKRVAIVCLSDASAYGPDSLSDTVARMLGAQLVQEVRGMTLIPHVDVEAWRDENGWNEMDFTALGEAVRADLVIAVEISAYSIHEGSTMFKGRATTTTTVYDIPQGGQVVFVHGPHQYEFPRSHARPIIGTSDAKFERAFLTKLTQQIGRLFHPYDRSQQFADDSWLFD